MNVGFIVKVSKLCNLRCTYCYETPWLADKARMSIDDIERMFLHIRNFFDQFGDKRRFQNKIELYWHGGEPLAQPLSYWEGIVALEEKIFGKRFVQRCIRNSIQSNLTLITPRHLPLIRKYFHLGFSYDVFNDYRVNAGGQSTDAAVREKIDWLLKEGISIGGIPVISKANAAYPEEVADFYLDRDLHFRALNIYRAKEMVLGAREAAVSYDDFIEFLETLYRYPRVSKALKKGMPINPLATSRQIYRRWKKGRRNPFDLEACAKMNRTLGINTNGDVYNTGDMYDPAWCFGNLFHQPLDEILSSEVRKRRVQETRKRLEKVCEQCPFFLKGCTGHYVNVATPEEYREFERKGICYYGQMAKVMQEESKLRKEARYGRTDQQEKNRPEGDQAHQRGP